ncbi:MAG: hypothetical protein Q9213_005823 [Squamulea squamosa]
MKKLDPAPKLSPEQGTASEGNVYIKMDEDGRIGTLVNTVDCLKFLAEGRSERFSEDFDEGLSEDSFVEASSISGICANFLDTGGKVTFTTVKRCFQLILADERVKVVFVVIFGGLTKCAMSHFHQVTANLEPEIELDLAHSDHDVLKEPPRKRLREEELEATEKLARALLQLFSGQVNAHDLMTTDKNNLSGSITCMEREAQFHSETKTTEQGFSFPGTDDLGCTNMVFIHAPLTALEVYDGI